MSSQGGARPTAPVPAALPTGVVTFLFSDIEGSTQRWEAHPEEMKAAVARHEQIMNGAIARHHGYVFKLMGDAFCAAFAAAPYAIAAACDAQRSLAAEDFSSVDGLRVRMGLHAGSAEERGSDYFGPTVNRVARLMSIGHGGQVLLSGVTVDLADRVLPSGTSLTDLGMRRLKDLTQPEQVWQLSIAGLPADFPPLNSLDARANNLPIQMTALLGRERDIEDVKSLLLQHRLLTLSGSGGVGKTRLALQVGADLIDRFSDGVWFADLAPIGDPELAASVIAKTVGLAQTAGQRVDAAIPEWLKRKRLLLILDNCEHILDAVARIADAIIRGCPGVQVLTTSRQALGIGGEAVHRLPSLSIPDSAIGLHAAEAMQYGSVALFVDRAQAVDTRFVLSDDTAPIVADICRHLDGIPLAIELAAARIKVLSIPNLAKRLDERFKILTGGSRTAMPRQKTLGALIDWSYDLLTAQERMLLDRVGIFAGGFSLDAATCVCGGEGLDEIDVLDLLSSLTDKSLVVAVTSEEQGRFRLLESTRAYALQKLGATEERDRMLSRHAAYYRSRAEALAKSFSTTAELAWLAEAERELDNFRAALEWALTDEHDLPLGATLAGRLGRLWSSGGLLVEGRYWIGRALTGLDASAFPREAAMLLRALATLYHAKPKRDYAARALAMYEALGDDVEIAETLLELSFAYNQMGLFDESESACARALVTMLARNDIHGIARCNSNLGSVRYLCGDYAGARASYRQTLAIHRASGNQGDIATTLSNFAELEFADGQVEQALKYVRESLEIDSQGKNAVRLALANTNIAAYCIAKGELDEARSAAREGLKWARRGQHTLGIAIVLQHFALLMALHGNAMEAARLIGYVDTRLGTLEYKRETTEKWSYEKLMAALRESLSGAEIEQLASEGAAWQEDHAVEEALKV